MKFFLELIVMVFGTKHTLKNKNESINWISW